LRGIEAELFAYLDESGEFAVQFMSLESEFQSVKKKRK
jgi:hypothetical protein